MYEYSHGRLESIVNYEHGILHGPTILYFVGRTSKQEDYANGILVGRKVYWDNGLVLTPKGLAL